MSIETDILRRMFKDDLQMAGQLLDIGDFSMALESLNGAIDKLHQIANADPAALNRNLNLNLPAPSETPIDI